MRISTQEHVDAARRLLRRRAFWVLLGAAPVLYAGAAALLYVNQEHLIFPGAARRLHALVPHAYYRELDCGHHDYHSDWQNIREFLVTAGLLPRP